LQAAQNFGGCFEHRLAAGLVDFLDIAAQMIDQLLQLTRDFLDVVVRIASPGPASLCLGHDAPRRLECTNPTDGADMRFRR
jgi:hypothetical protein